MAEQKSDQEKTEEPTQRKMEQAREEGNVSVSKEISSVLLMVVSVMLFVGAGGFMYSRLVAIFEMFFLNAGSTLQNQDQAMQYLKLALWYGFEMMMPILIILLVTALLVNLLQTGGVFSVKAIQPKGSKMNPVNGI